MEIVKPAIAGTLESSGVQINSCSWGVLRMQNTAAALAQILSFRELKADAQQNISRPLGGCDVLSFGMNIPGPIKTSAAIHRGFLCGIRRLKQVLIKANVKILAEQVMESPAGYAAIYAVSGMSAQALKLLVMALEDTHPLGRLWDFDVLIQGHIPVGRENLEKPGRPCLICGSPAKLCARSQAHSREELAQAVQLLLDSCDQEDIPAQA